MDKYEQAAIAAGVIKQGANVNKAAHIGEVANAVLRSEITKHNASFNTASIAGISALTSMFAEQMNNMVKASPDSASQIPMMSAALQYLFGTSIATLGALVASGKYDAAVAGMAPTAPTGSTREPVPTADTPITADAALAEVYSLLGLKEPGADAAN